MTYLIESIDKARNTELILFSRENGVKKMKVVSDFICYFYVLADEPVQDDYRIRKIEHGYVGLLGEKLKKIYVRKSSDVRELRKSFTKYWEGDILVTQRYIIDKIGVIDPYKLQIVSIDIETDSAEFVPDVEKPNQAITSICLKDTFTNNATKLILNNKKWSEEQKDKLNKLGCIICYGEEELLNIFIKVLNEYDPDIITGYFIDQFDLPYLIRRMEMFHVEYRKLSPLNFVKIDDKYKEVTIKGRVIIDMHKAHLHFRKLTNQGKLESNSLEFVSQTVLNTGKIKHKESYREMWESYPDKLVEYNLRDVELVLQINNKLGIIDFFNTIRCMACSQLKNIYHSSVLIDGLLLNRCKNKLVLPSNMDKIKGDKYSGGYVSEPIPGIYDNVIVLDLLSLYPSIIKSLNIGYESFNPEGSIQIEPGIGFNDGTNICSELLKDLMKERLLYKKLRDESTGDLWRFYNYRQNGVKILSNSIYGYFGFSNSRLYKKEVANAITTIGRKIIKWASSVVTNKGHTVIYNDTDSVFLLANEEHLFNIIKEGNEITNEINESYKAFIKSFGGTQNYLEIQFEKIVERILFVGKKGEETEGAKKKYAYKLLWEGSKKVTKDLQFKGFETIRSNSPRIARKVQKDVLTMVMNKTSKEEVVTYLKDTYKKIIEKQIPDEEVAFPQGISKSLKEYGVSTIVGGKTRKAGTPPVVRGAKYSNKFLGTRFGKGSKAKWIYVTSVPQGYPNTNVITFDEEIPKGFNPDYDIMCNHIFKEKLSEIFKAVRWGEFPNLSDEKTMDSWS